MDHEDSAKIEKIISDRKHAHGRLSRDSPVYRAFLEVEKAAFASGRLEKAVKELIALGISVVVNCESCMQWHVQQALLAGASEQQVLEAVEVGIEMGGGTATVSARFALKVLEYHRRKEGD